MDILLKALRKSVEHLETLDRVFSTFNYPEKGEYLRNRSEIKKLNATFPQKLTDELYYGDDGRQMILNDIIEYIFSARGYFYMWQPEDIEKKKVFIKLLLHFINQLMILESISVDHSLRNQVLDELKKHIGSEFFLNTNSQVAFDALKQFTGDVHFDTATSNSVPATIVTKMGLEDSDQALKRFNGYSDSLLPKLPHGLWRELIVYIQLLRINAGVILPMLLNQRIISKDNALKPTDFIVIKENGELVAVEVGAGKEGQVSEFSTRMRCQVVSATNTNIPPRCPICGKWVLFCDKVIEDYSDLNDPLYYIYDDIRCAHDCDIYSYEEVLSGKCPYVKYRGIIDKRNKPRQQIKFETSYHYHYSCILKTKDPKAMNEIQKQKERWKSHLERRGSVKNTSRQMTINCLKTNYPYFGGLDGLENYTPNNLNCYSKYLQNRNCSMCDYADDCKRLSIVIPLVDEVAASGDKELLKEELKRLIPKKGEHHDKEDR